MSARQAKCGIRGCKFSGNAPLITCAAPACSRKVHDICYRGAILQRLKLGILEKDGQELKVCTKKCHSEAAKTITGSRRLLWTKDGRNGPDDPVNSESLLLDWMTTEGNFARFRGNKEGLSKMNIAQEVVTIFKARGIRAERTPKHVVDKINILEQSFKKALDWKNNTGQGVKETDEGGFWAAIRNRCPHWDVLEPIMIDRASCRPLATTDDLDNSDDDEDDDGVEDTIIEPDQEDDHPISPNRHELTADDVAVDGLTQLANAASNHTNEVSSPIANTASNIGSNTTTQPDSTEATSGANKENIPCSAHKENIPGTGVKRPKSTSSVPLSLAKKRKGSKGSNGASTSANSGNAFLKADESFFERLRAMKNEDKKLSSWKEKNEKLEFKINCARKLAELRELQMSERRIRKKFPELIDFMDDDDSTSDLST